MTLYTKNGVPLQVSGDYVYSSSGTVVGRVKGSKVFGPNGQYVGTISGNRLVYRSSESSAMSSSFSKANRAGTGLAHAAGSGIYGDEPNIPD